ncbi:MAG: deoxyribonuclease IV [Chloroflexi bacterium]|nr:deoxyribonuclease IV [Chloroflexota bacterium]
MLKPRLGAHMSIDGSPAQALVRGQQVGCETIQIFTRNANRWSSRDLTDKEIADFHQACLSIAISPVVAHSSYLINLGSPDDVLWEKSIDAAVTEVQRCQVLQLSTYILHPGAHMGTGEEAGLRRITVGLDRVLEATADTQVIITLETTAGQGSSLGCTFEHLGYMIANSIMPERLGVCFDTAHALAAGYEYRQPDTYRTMWEHFNQVIGIDKLRAIHMNDSKKDLGSRVDRHEQIGQGFVTLEAFRMLLNDPRLVRIPMILETPKGPEMLEDIQNLAVLRSLIAPSN